MKSNMKVGLAIGGILLAAMVVYILMPVHQKSTPVGSEEDRSLVAETPTTEPTTAPVAVGSDHDPFARSSPTTQPDNGAVVSSNPNRDVWASALETGQIPSYMSQNPGANHSASSANMLGGATTQPAMSARTHKVQSGETMYSISMAAYGSAKYVNRIVKANPNINPSRLRVGTVINLPELGDTSASNVTAASIGTRTAERSTANVGKTYQVQSGDTLRKIAVKLYGKREMWQKIYDLNKASIGAEPSRLKQGMVLRLPEGASSATAVVQ